VGKYSELLRRSGTYAEKRNGCFRKPDESDSATDLRLAAGTKTTDSTKTAGTKAKATNKKTGTTN
jgi:hypothetical protein